MSTYPSQPDIPVGEMIAGNTMGLGNCDSATQRVVIACDTDWEPILAAGSAVIGHVINDASSAVIGHVIADHSSAVIGTVQQATTNVAVAAGTTTAAQIIKGTPGYLSGVIITDADASGVDTIIYDHATLASGTVIGYIPGNAALGTYWPCNMPAELGITVGKLNHSLGLTVAFS